MSENIQSISLGTYTIGNTNELTFSAGPGIKIDSPSAGTVRIGTDETVLWSSTSSAGDTISEGGYITLTDDISNFEAIEIYYVHQSGWGVPCVFKLFPSTSQGNFCLEQIWFREQSGFNNYWQSVSFMKYNSTNKTITVNQVSQRAILNTYWNANTGLNITLFKIVGINRISGNA